MELRVTADLERDEYQFLRDRLDEYNAETYGPTKVTEFGLAIRRQDHAVVGGLIGSVLWDWLHIHVIWVSKELRGDGYGSQLLSAAEKEGLVRGCNYVKLHTFSFQARPFYERHGYSVIAETKDFPQGHSQYLMFKQLVSQGGG